MGCPQPLGVNTVKISRREMLGTCVATGAALASNPSTAEAPAQKRPNIVVIMADDIGYECYGAYGSTHYRTPRFDALAREGALFTHAYAQPLCTPSRVKIMTGKYNFRNYVKFGVLDFAEPTFAKMLKAAGYKTCIAGKWQLSPGDLEGPHKAGFDEYLLWHFQFEGQARTDAGDFADKGSRYKSPKLYRDGVRVENTDGKYGPDLCDEFIADFMERNKSEPFLVYYPMILVHDPYEPVPESPDWESGGKDNKHFPDMVHYMDKCIGRVVDKLDALGLRENTLLIVTGDNGTGREITSPMPGREPIKGGKGAMTDAGTHVGFVANWPGRIRPGTVVNAPIDFADVLPTLADVAGLPIPEYADGQSMLPLVTGHEDKARGWVFISYARNPESPADYRHFVSDTRWKLYSDGKIFDLSNDIDELSPAIGPGADGARKRLQPILNRILLTQ